MVIAKKLSEKYDIPYIIDFRDSFIDEKDIFYQLLMKKITQQLKLRNAAGLIFATKGMQEFFIKNASRKLKKIPASVIYNGVDEINDNPSPDVSDEKIVLKFNELKQLHAFVLLHTGTLYSGQISAFFLRGVESFNKQHRTNGIVVFLGLTENNATNTLNYPFVHVLPKVQHATAMYSQKHASALLLPIWDGRYTGFSGKTLEYIFSSNFIITSPEPQDDLKEFFDISPNVFVPEDATAFENFLSSLFSNSLIKRDLKNRTKLYRSYWVKKMSLFLEGLK